MSAYRKGPCSRGRVCLRGLNCLRVRVCLRAGAVFPRPSLPAGRDFGPVRTCGAFPPTAARRAPHRSRSHGRLRRPKSLPIRHSPAAAQCLTHLGWRDYPCFDLLAAAIRKSRLEIGNHCTDCPRFDLMAASIRKSGLEIENRCTDCPRFDLLAASIRKSGPEIRNRCNTIDAASRTARLRKVVAATIPRPIPIFVAAK